MASNGANWTVGTWKSSVALHPGPALSGAVWPACGRALHWALPAAGDNWHQRTRTVVCLACPYPAVAQLQIHWSTLLTLKSKRIVFMVVSLL